MRTLYRTQLPIQTHRPFARMARVEKKSIPVHLLAFNKVLDTTKGLEKIEWVHIVDFFHALFILDSV